MRLATITPNLLLEKNLQKIYHFLEQKYSTGYNYLQSVSEQTNGLEVFNCVQEKQSTHLHKMTLIPLGSKER